MQVESCSAKDDELESLLDGFLTRKQQRKRLRQRCHSEAATRRRAFAERKAKREQSLKSLDETYPRLKKTLQEIRDMEIGLPPDLFPKTQEHEQLLDGGNMSIEAFSWKGHRNGMAERLRDATTPTTPSARIALQTPHNRNKMPNDRRKKRKRQSRSTSLRRKRKRRSPSEDVSERIGNSLSERPKTRMAIVQVEHVRRLVPSPLLTLYETAREAVTTHQYPIQVQLLTKRVLSKIHIEVPTNTFFVEFKALGSDGRCYGFFIGYDDDVLYFTKFQKGTETVMKSAMQSIDPTDPGLPPPSFAKAEKLCYQWMQRLAGNVDGVYFSATDLYRTQTTVTMEMLLAAVLMNCK